MTRRDPDLGRQRWLRCRNVSGEDIPPWSPVEIVGTQARASKLILQVDRPNLQDPGSICDEPHEEDYIANWNLAAVGPTRIKAGAFGQVTTDTPMWLRYDRSAYIGGLTYEIPRHGQLWVPAGFAMRQADANLDREVLGVAGLRRVGLYCFGGAFDEDDAERGRALFGSITFALYSTVQGGLVATDVI